MNIKEIDRDIRVVLFLDGFDIRKGLRWWLIEHQQMLRSGSDQIFQAVDQTVGDKSELDRVIIDYVIINCLGDTNREKLFNGCLQILFSILAGLLTYTGRLGM